MNTVKTCEDVIDKIRQAIEILPLACRCPDDPGSCKACLAEQDLREAERHLKNLMIDEAR